MTLSSSLEQSARPVWAALFDHPFVREMAAGTLPPEKFRFYIEQNLLYLPEYARALALGAAKSRSPELLSQFAAALTNILDVEIPYNQSLLAQVADHGSGEPATTIMAPATLAYTSYLTAAAFKGGELEILTLIMPCAWSYGQIARSLSEQLVEHSVYTRWIQFFATDEYEVMVKGMCDQLDRLAAREGRTEDPALTELFVNASRLEKGFWDMAYGTVQWPDAVTTAGAAG